MPTPTIRTVHPLPPGGELHRNGLAAPDNENEAATVGQVRNNSKRRADHQELEKQIESLSVPGFKVQQDGVFTLIKRTTAKGRSRTFPARLARWILQYDKWLPLVYRYAKESIQLAPRRMLIFFCGKLLKSLAPTARLWASTQMLYLVDKAIKTGEVDKLKLFACVGLAGFLSTGLRTVRNFFTRNEGVLERKVNALLTSRILGVLATLDWPAASDPLNNKIISNASRDIEQAGSDKAFKVIADIFKVVSTFAGVITQTWYLKRNVTRHNVDLFIIGLVANFVDSADWLFQGDSGVYSGVTNEEYHRMDHIWNEATVDPEFILLNLGNYYKTEYDNSDKRMGDIHTSRLKESTSISRATAIFHNFSNPAIYALFALRAAARRGKSGTTSALYDATFSSNALSFIQTATSALAGEVAALFYVVDDVRSHCTDILHQYKVLDLKPLLPQPIIPAKYETQIVRPASKDKKEMRGMAIECRDVQFRYPDSDRNALDGVNFKITPGSLVCIVGYNGAGKSSLINLISRIVDPSSGQVLINGIDAKQFNPSDLYSRISCQFQDTMPPDFTIREWLHMGDVNGVNDEEKMIECLRITGADKILARFPKGLDARLGPYPADDTPQSLLKEYIKSTETGGFDPWEEQFQKTMKAEIEDEEEWEDTVIGGSGIKNKDCSFSPGEWSKFCFARTLMRKVADLRIFDEPTAKLDPIASRAVFDKIESLRGECTVIHITHDLTACLKADQVILFEEGKSVEAGTHEALLSSPNSKYAEFYNASMGHREDEEDTDESGTEDENEGDDVIVDADDASQDQLEAEPGSEVKLDEILTSHSIEGSSIVSQPMSTLALGPNQLKDADCVDQVENDREVGPPANSAFQDEEGALQRSRQRRVAEEDEEDQLSDGDSGFGGLSDSSACGE